MRGSTTRTAGRFARQVPEETLVDITARRVLGESIRTIATATGVPRSTVADLLKAPDIATMVAEEKRVEQRRAGDRERQRRKTERDRRARHGVAPDANPMTPVRERPTIREQSSRKTGDGHILGVVVGAMQASPEITIFGDGSTSQSYAQWLDTPRDLPPGETDVRVEYDGIHGPGSFGFDVSDTRDLARAADLLTGEGIGPNRNEIIETLSRLRPGAHVRFTVEEPDPA